MHRAVCEEARSTDWETSAIEAFSCGAANTTRKTAWRDNLAARQVRFERGAIASKSVQRPAINDQNMAGDIAGRSRSQVGHGPANVGR